MGECMCAWVSERSEEDSVLILYTDTHLLHTKKSCLLPYKIKDHRDAQNQSVIKCVIYKQQA